MKKNKIIITILFLVGLTFGYYYNQRIHEVREQPVSDYNRISRYDLYNYEEAILKEGNYQKLFDLIGEADVDRLPYTIVMCDAYNNLDAGDLLLQLYLLYYGEIKNRNKRAMIPLKEYVKTIIIESTEKGHHFSSEHLKELKKYE